MHGGAPMVQLGRMPELLTQLKRGAPPQNVRALCGRTFKSPRGPRPNPPLHAAHPTEYDSINNEFNIFKNQRDEYEIKRECIAVHCSAARRCPLPPPPFDPRACSSPPRSGVATVRDAESTPGPAADGAEPPAAEAIVRPAAARAGTLLHFCHLWSWSSMFRRVRVFVLHTRMTCARTRARSATRARCGGCSKRRPRRCGAPANTRLDLALTADCSRRCSGCAVEHEPHARRHRRDATDPGGQHRLVPLCTAEGAG